MTRYRVIVTPEAQQSISTYYDYIAASSPMNAGKWATGLYRKIDRLELFPRGLGTAREQPFFDAELRQLIYKSHRIIYTIDDKAKAVIVVQVRHAKRRPLGAPQGEN
jgi:plasmid stabilization system protein ParE